MENTESLSKLTLTPKNLYRCLTYRLHPGRQNNIFPTNLSGFTLVRFWKEILTPVLPGPVLISLFATDGKRSRRLSDLMNRTGPWTMTRELEEALVRSLEPDFFSELVGTCSQFLKNNHYVAPVYQQELKHFVDECCDNDRALKSVSDFLRGLFIPAPGQDEGIPLLFRDGYRLAWVAMIALFGGNLRNGYLMGLCTMEASSCQKLWNRQMPEAAGTRSFNVLTTRTSLLCRRPTPKNQFVGRDQELERLCQTVQTDGKVLVSGMGGIGKTELVRQAIQRFEKQRLFRWIAYVQYNGSLAASYRLAFPGMEEENDDAVLRLVRYKLEHNGPGNTLLLIDDLNTTEENDPPVADLESYGCEVIVTSRRQNLSGFTDIHVMPLSMEASASLFAYHSDLLPQELPLELLAMADGHPLALALMGNLCRLRHCRPDELKLMLDQQGLSGIVLTRDTPAKKLQGMLNDIYRENALDDSMGRLLALFSTFPVMMYSIELLRPVLADMGSAQLVDELLAEAANYGWLEEDRTGYFMHPVIAEFFQSRSIFWSDFPMLRKWIDDCCRCDISLMPQTDILRTLLCAGSLNRLQISDDNQEILPLLLLTASRLPGDYAALSGRLLSRCEQLIKRKPSDSLRFWLLCCQLFLTEVNGDAKRAKVCCSQAASLVASADITPVMLYGIRAASVSANNFGFLEESEQILLTTLAKAPRCPQLVTVLLAAAEHYIVHGRQMDKVEAYTAKAHELLDDFMLGGTLYEVDLMHQETMNCYINRDADRGFPICADTIRRYTAYLGTDEHPVVGDLCRLAAMFCLMLEDTERAKAYFEQAYRIMDPQKRGDTLPAALIECSYATLCRNLGQYRQAYEMSLKGLNGLRHFLGKCPNTASALRIHGEICEAVGKHEEAIDCIRQCVEMWSSTAGPDYVETARAELILTRLLLPRRRWAEAKRRISHASQILKDELGEEAPETLEATELLRQADQKR